MDCTAKNFNADILREGKASHCPYRNVASNICSASLFRMKIDPQIFSSCCSSDYFSDCPLFLSKTLRAG